MNAWSREARQQLPEWRRLIESAENPMTLWIRELGRQTSVFTP